MDGWVGVRLMARRLALGQWQGRKEVAGDGRCFAVKGMKIGGVAKAVGLGETLKFAMIG